MNQHNRIRMVEPNEKPPLQELQAKADKARGFLDPPRLESGKPLQQVTFNSLHGRDESGKPTEAFRRSLSKTTYRMFLRRIKSQEHDKY